MSVSWSKKETKTVRDDMPKPKPKPMSDSKDWPRLEEPKWYERPRVREYALVLAGGAFGGMIYHGVLHLIFGYGG